MFTNDDPFLPSLGRNSFLIQADVLYRFVAANCADRKEGDGRTSSAPKAKHGGLTCRSNQSAHVLFLPFALPRCIVRCLATESNRRCWSTPSKIATSWPSFVYVICLRHFIGNSFPTSQQFRLSLVSSLFTEQCSAFVRV